MVNLSFCWLTVRQRAVMGKLPQWHLWIFPSWYRVKTDDKIHFKAITVQEAQALYVEEMKELDGLRKIIHQPCKEVLDCRLVAKRLRKLFEE